jgi:uncharacterized protein involved in exopolysaccharide biosynthesis
MQNPPTTNQSNLVTRPVPPDQISPKAVVLRIMGIKSVFQRNWKLLLLLTAIGGVIGFIFDYTHKKQPIYSAFITFNLGGGSASGGNFGELGALAGAFGLSPGAADANIFTGDNFIIYSMSRAVLEKTLMKMDTINGKDTLLANYYIRHSGIRDKEWEESDTLRAFAFTPGKLVKDFTKLEQQAMSDVCARIKTEMGVTQPERKSSFMELRCGMQDEKLAASLLTTHLETIEEDYKKKQTKKTREMYDLLNSRADSLLRILTGTENKLAQYADQNQQVVVAQGRLMETKLTRNSTFLTQLYYAALQQADNMRLSLIREAPLFNIIDPVAFPLYKEIKAPVGMRIGIALGLLLSVIVVFFRETYRSIMREE